MKSPTRFLKDLARLVDWFPFKFPFQLNQPYQLNKVFKIINTGGPQIVLILCSQGNVLLQKSYYLIGDWFSTKVAIYDFCIFKVPFFSSFSIIKVLFFSYLTQKSMHSWLLSKVWNIIHSTQPTYLYFQQRKSPEFWATKWSKEGTWFHSFGKRKSYLCRIEGMEYIVLKILWR